MEKAYYHLFIFFKTKRGEKGEQNLTLSQILKNNFLYYRSLVHQIYDSLKVLVKKKNWVVFTKSSEGRWESLCFPFLR